jgi:hypothetical protein
LARSANIHRFPQYDRQLIYRDLFDSDHNPKRFDCQCSRPCPVILDPDGYDLWLDPGMKDVSVASELLKPYDARLMRGYPISARINHTVNDDEECSAPVELAKTEASLFS